MKQFSVYLLILVLCSTNNIFKEFLKAPLLVGHFIEHQHKDPAISFMKFMSMHYFGEDLKDNDQREDRKLPFKNISHAAHPVLFHPPFLNTHLSKVFPIEKQEPPYQPVFFQHHSCDQLYRPPQSFAG